MTDLVATIKAEMKAAMKARDKPRLGTIRLIQAEFKRIEVDERIDIDDARALTILDKMVKQRRDSATQYRDANREELAVQEDLEIAVIQEFLPEVLGQALARTWIDKRFLEAFYEYPEEILERGGVYLPDHISVEFMKKDKSRPKVVVYENGNQKRRKILELKLIMVAEE